MKILYPPRPEGRIRPEELPTYEKTGRWLVQRKFNGTHVVINVSPEGKVGILTRHGEAPKQFSLTPEHQKQVLSLRLERGKEYWLQGELLHSKTTTECYKNRIVLFDVLQAGRYFFGGPTLLERLGILDEICRSPKTLEPNLGIALQVTEYIWMAEFWKTGFVEQFKKFIAADEIEGLVLKRWDKVLDNFGRKEYDVNWMIRCRKPHKNYRF